MGADIAAPGQYGVGLPLLRSRGIPSRRSGSHALRCAAVFSLCQAAITSTSGQRMPIVAIEHVQLAMPARMEQAAREFYQGLLGIPEVPKPPELAKRGGAWFEQGALKIHLGVEADFRPARKAHPALLVTDLESLVVRLKHHNIDVVDDDPLEGYLRVYIADPFGNRIELMEPR